MRNTHYYQYFIRLSVALVALVAAIKIFVFDFYRVASESMEPALLVGDFIAVNKITPNIRSGAIIVFKLPDDAAIGNTYERGSVFVKRILAMSGDLISWSNDTLAINGRRTKILAKQTSRFFCDASLIMPRKGEIIDLNPEKEQFWRPLLEREGHSIIVKNRIVFIDGNPAVDYELQQDYCFVAGDNSENSYDSRFWGLLPVKSIIGTPMFIFWSASDSSGIRYNRIGAAESLFD